MWKFIKTLAVVVWAIVCALIGTLVYMTQTPPKEAKSALSDWAAEFGLSDLPGWMQKQSADAIVLAICIFFLACSAIALVLIVRANRQKKLEQESGLVSLADLPNSEIRMHVKRLASKMKKFQEQINNQRDNNRQLVSNFSRTGNATDIEHLKRVGDYDNRISSEANNRMHLDFDMHCRPFAQALKTEILRRLNLARFLEHHGAGESAIDHGMLAGPYPISDAALFLEELVRKLPLKDSDNAISKKAG